MRRTRLGDHPRVHGKIAVVIIVSVFSVLVLASPTASGATYSKTVNAGWVSLTVTADYSGIWDWNLRNDVDVGITMNSIPSNFGGVRILGGSATLHQNGTDYLLATSKPSSQLDNTLLTSPGTYSVTFSFDHTFTNHAQAGQVYAAHILLGLSLLTEMANGSKPYTFMNGDTEMVVRLNTSNPHQQPSFLGLSMWALLLVMVAVILSIGGFLAWLSKNQQKQDEATHSNARGTAFFRFRSAGHQLDGRRGGWIDG